MTSDANFDPAEVDHFDRLAARWWDADGELRTLHDLNPLRVQLITAWTEPAGRRVVDVGCGGGLLTEALARAGGQLTGIDLSPAAIEVASLHRLESGLADIRYLVCDAATLAAREPGGFDIACCLELIEHVPDPAALVAATARLVRPGGSVVVSSINRSVRAWLTAIVGGEYLTGLIPRGTHRFDQLIRPGELDRHARAAGLELVNLRGVRYDPATRRAHDTPTPDVNDIAHVRRPAAP
jgi:2-polyprenyl-6-hydroxyphenyl methylase/3-demethylubiquinone-9 3-methyltransferase